MRSIREQLGFGKSEGVATVVILNGYPLAVVIAITLHSVLLAGLLYLQNHSQSQALELVQPTVIKALLIEENPQVTNQRNQERRRIENQRRERERQEAAAQKRRDEEAAAKRAEQERIAEQRKAAEAKSRAEAKAKSEAEAKARAEAAERDRREREQIEREQRERREIQERAERERRDREAAADAAAAEAASSEFELIQSATGLIQQLVTEHWSRPPSARNGMRAVIQIRMLPTGELIDATITQSSGDPAFDRSAENAVYRAAPFSELTALPIRVFNENFRTLSLIFQPEDLLN